jgi:ribonuclease P protein component
LHNTRQASREFVVLVSAAGPVATGRVRVGITASRKVGNAVARNRVKRAVRDWFRTRKPRLPAVRRDGLDVVVIARRGATHLAPIQIAERLDVLVERAVRALP